MDQRINLTKMSMAELQAHLTAVQRAIEARKEIDKALAKRALADRAKELGFSIEELFGAEGAAASEAETQGRRPVEPKFRHPDDASLTWSGRGKPPKWLVAYEAGGGSREDLRISG